MIRKKQETPKVKNQESSFLSRSKTASLVAASGSVSQNTEKDLSLKDNLSNNYIVKFCDFFINLSLVSIFLGIPLFFTGYAFQGIGFEKQMFFYIALLAGIFAWILKSIIKGRVYFKRTPLDIPIIIFIAALLFSSIFSINSTTSFLGSFGSTSKSFVAVLSFALFYWFVVCNINKKRLNIIFKSLMASLAVISLISFFNFWEINCVGWIIGLFTSNVPIWAKSIAGVSGFNTIGLLSNLQIFVSASILIVIGIWGRAKDSDASLKKFNFENIILGLTLALNVFIIAVLGNYSSLIGLLVGLGLIVVLVIAGLINTNTKLFSLICLLFVFTLVYIIIGKPAIPIRNFNPEVGISRSLSWKISKEGFKENYLLGAGLGNFEYLFNKHKPQSFNNNMFWETRFSEPQGLFNEMLSLTGLIGLASFALLILTFIGVAIYFMLKRDQNAAADKEKSQNGYLFVVLFAATASLGIDCLFYLTGGCLLIFTVMTGTLAMAWLVVYKGNYFKEISLSYKIKPEYSLALSFLFVCLSCLMIFIFISTIKIYAADIYVKSAFVAKDENEAMEKVKKAISFYPYQAVYYEKLADVNTLAANNEMEKEDKNVEKAQELFAQALELHKKAIELKNESAYNWESLGLISEAILSYDGTLIDQAESSYKKAIELNPNNPALRVRLATIMDKKVDLLPEEEKEEKSGKLYEESRKYYKKAIELKPNLTIAYNGLSALEEKLGNIDEAINNMVPSYNLNLKDSFYAFNLGRLFYNKAVNGIEKPDQETFQNASSTPEAVAEKFKNNEELKTAEALFIRAININPKYIDALYSLGLLYDKQELRSEAKQVYKRALEYLPKNDNEARRIIEEKLK